MRSGFPGGSVVNNLPANAGDTREMSSVPGLGRSPREETDFYLGHSLSFTHSEGSQLPCYELPSLRGPHGKGLRVLLVICQ